MLRRGVFVVMVIVCFSTCNQPAITDKKGVAVKIINDADSFTLFIQQQFIPAVNTTGNNGKHLQQLFLQARLAYKKFEWAAEYFSPAVAKKLNGQPAAEIREPLPPEGLQVIETLLYPAYDTANKQQLLRELQQLPAAAEKCALYFQHIDVMDWQVFDAARLEIFRIDALGIAGFDAQLSQNSMRECAAALSGMQHIVSMFDRGEVLTQPFKNAESYLSANNNFNSFNRAAFITQYANPLSAKLYTLEKKLHISEGDYNRLLRQDAVTFFDTGAFNAFAYMPGGYTNKNIDAGKGEKLFNSVELSGNRTRSCATCHQPSKAFTDGLFANTAIDGNGLLKRNTPTLLNAALQPSLFYDMRVNSLEAQVMDVVQSSHEMHCSPALVKQRTGMDIQEVAKNIAAYVRTLVKLNSRFDAYMRGDARAMSVQEVNGFNLFMGRAKCGTCHFMPLFNGTMPPAYIYGEAEVIGVPATNKLTVADDDAGVYMHAFKTPTLRNAALTAPYMHNGVYATLQQVIDFYDKGGGQGEGLPVPNQTLPSKKLLLTAKEKLDLLAFINCLNSR